MLEAEAHEPLRGLALLEWDRARLSEDDLCVAAEVHDLGYLARPAALAVKPDQFLKSMHVLKSLSHGASGAMCAWGCCPGLNVGTLGELAPGTLPGLGRGTLPELAMGT